MIAVRIADAVTSVLPVAERNIEWNPAFAHRVEEVEISRRRLREEDIKTPRATHHRPQLETVEQAFERLRKEFRTMREEFEAQPELKQRRGWFNEITAIYWRMRRASRVLDRYAIQQTQPTIRVEIQVLRLGEMAIATNRFELYLDFGIQIRTRSPAVQTFVVQLAGPASYVPTARSVAGGAYGAVPESTEVGPEGGRELVEHTVDLLNSLWPEN
jgi:hypothetical protein